MPSIQVYTAQTAPKVPHQPMQFVESGEAPEAARLAHQTQNIVEQWAGIVGRMEAQQVDIEAVQKKNDREAALADAILEIQRDPEVIQNPRLFESKYQEKAQEIDSTIAQTIQSPGAAKQYEVYRQRELPMERVKVKAMGLKMWEAKMGADFIAEEDRLSTKAASAVTEKEFNDAIDTHHNLVTNTVNNKGMSQAEGEKHLIEFKKETAAKNMSVVGARSPSLMRELQAQGRWDKDVPKDKQAQIMEHYATQEHVLAGRQAEVFKAAQKTYIDGMQAQANFGLLPRSVIERGQKGLDPMQPDPIAWNELAKLNENAPGLSVGEGQGVDAVAAIRTAHSTTEPSREDAVKALGELELLRQEGGLSRKAMKDLREASEHFQSRLDRMNAIELAATKTEEARQRQAEADRRASQNEVYQQQQRAKAAEHDRVQKALVEWDAEQKAQLPLGGAVGEMQEKKAKIERKRFEDLLNKGFDKDKAKELMRPPAPKGVEPKGPSAIDMWKERQRGR